MNDIKKKTCPNPNCRKQIPWNANKCKYCDTRLNATNANKSTKQGYPVLPVLEPLKLGGVCSGLVMLTPLEIRHTAAPGLLKEHAVLEIDLSTNAKQLHYDIWIDVNSRKRTFLGVYKVGLLFPPACPVNMKPPTHYEWVEVPISRRYLGKVVFNTRNQDKADRIAEALTCDRYWVAIPFSHGHVSGDRTVHLNRPPENHYKNSYKTEIIFTNREYARQFYELNKLKKAKWLNIKCLYKQVAGVLCLLIGGVITTVGVIIYFEGAEGCKLNGLSEGSIYTVVDNKAGFWRKPCKIKKMVG